MKSNIKAHHIANQIRMTRSQYSGCFMIVEGKTGDFRFYGQFVNSKSCRIIPAHGKDNAVCAFEILENDKTNGVLCVVDADFWRLEGRRHPSPNLFITDTHDIETMILKSPALEKLLIEFGSDKKESFVRQADKSVRQVLLDSGRPIGYLRWIAQQQNFSLTFEGIKFSEFTDRKTLVTDTVKLIRTIKNKSGRHDIPEGNLLNAIDEVADNSHDSWDVCCGHDLVCILSFGLRYALGSNDANDVKPDLLEKFLRVAYEYAYFVE
ncbi:MAG: DUF4435 domain-containing protein, partial [Desulfobacterales bacterium]|nr:DUF4435 domain-containing protein [Desulfobacterales bacterium]